MIVTCKCIVWLEARFGGGWDSMIVKCKFVVCLEAGTGVGLGLHESHTQVFSLLVSRQGLKEGGNP